MLTKYFLTLPSLLHLFQQSRLQSGALLMFLFLFTDRGARPLFRIGNLCRVDSIVRPGSRLVTRVRTLLLISYLMVRLNRLVKPTLHGFLLLVFLGGASLFVREYVLHSNSLVFRCVLTIVVAYRFSMFVGRFYNFASLSRFREGLSRAMGCILTSQHSIMNGGGGFLILFVTLINHMSLTRCAGNASIFRAAPIGTIGGLRNTFMVLNLSRLVSLSRLGTGLLFVRGVRRLSVVEVDLPCTCKLIGAL